MAVLSAIRVVLVPLFHDERGVPAMPRTSGQQIIGSNGVFIRLEVSTEDEPAVGDESLDSA